MTPPESVELHYMVYRLRETYRGDDAGRHWAGNDAYYHRQDGRRARVLKRAGRWCVYTCEVQ